VDAARLQRIQEIFHAVRESAPSERESVLSQACQGDQDLRKQVVSLLAGASSDDELFPRQAISLLAQAIAVDLSPGQSLGPYRIEAHLGEGGMGKVYKARDTRLRRTVAVKISKFEFNQRFEREARAVAALNHPNICTLYDIGPNYLVMEFVEGSELKGPLPFAKAVDYACQILGALDVAHRKGIVHRDLKPANILVTKSGVKVLDFGLAKVPASQEEDSASNATTAITSEGTIAGTLHYMAPEQLQAGQIDTRADIFSFGCVLYEMLTGKRAFDGSNPASVIAAVMERPGPSVSKVAPVSLDRALQRCLEKDPETRWQNARDLMMELQWIAQKADEATALVSKPGLERWSLLAIAGLLAAGAAWGWLRPHSPAAKPPALAFTVTPPAGMNLAAVGNQVGAPQVSPDSAYLVEANLLRDLNSFQTEAMPAWRGMTGAEFWSADSKWLAIPFPKNLTKVHLPDGAPETIADLAGPTRGGAWAADGTILLAFAGGKPGLYLLAPDSRQFEKLSIPDLTDGRFSWPEFVAGGPDFLFFFRELNSDEGAVYLATLQGRKLANLTRIMKNETAAHYSAADGHLLFVQDDKLYSQEFSLRQRKLIGEPGLIEKSVASAPGVGLADFSISRSGVLTWRPGVTAASQVTAFDRDGQPAGLTGPPSNFVGLRLSPDEAHLLTRSGDGSSQILEVDKPGVLRLGKIQWLVWSSDGSRLFGSNGSQILERPANGAGDTRPVATTPDIQFVEDVSRDGKLALYVTNKHSVFSVRLDGDLQSKPMPLADTGDLISAPRFLPDGQSVIYSVAGPNNRSSGIFVQPLAGSGLRRQILNGGINPISRGDGKEILYVDGPPAQVWSLPVSGPVSSLRFGTPKPLFRINRLATDLISGLDFLAVSRDGSRIYFPQEVEQPEDSKVIEVRSGWAKTP